jgi:hypothetical protein
MGMGDIVATTALDGPPAWAVLERRLFDALDGAWRVFSAKYTEDDGRLIYRGKLAGRDGADDFYEPFFNWPTLYALGGSDDVLAASKRHWSGVTNQLTEAGFVVDEYERGYDWFHQGESLLFFYGICAADPNDTVFRDRALRFADLYLPGGPNYDPATNTITAPHNGAGGPRPGLGDGWSSYRADQPSMRPYGLPVHYVPGVSNWDDLRDPDNAARMGAAMRDRMGAGDVAVNLAATALVANAWLYDHDSEKSGWIERYVGGWMDRAALNDGLIPDNVGPHGVVGELHDGRWFGGHYGWTWPHGLHSVGAAALVAGTAMTLVTGDQAGLDLARTAVDTVYRHRKRARVRDVESSLKSSWLQRLGAAADVETVLVPYRFGQAGWFDYTPIQTALSAWLWHTSRRDDDWARLMAPRDEDGVDWRTVRAFRDKEEAGHEQPWVAYLSGDNPDYPERALLMAMGQVNRRLALIDTDHADLATVHIHHWQQLNPVVTEVLTQLTTGAPQVLYNGGLRSACVTYADQDRRRPGLPPDVAALVTEVGARGCVVELANLSPGETRKLSVIGGAFGEHRIDSVRYDSDVSGYPGQPSAYVAPPQATRMDLTAPADSALRVTLPPLTRVRLELAMSLRACSPAHGPWARVI